MVTFKEGRAAYIRDASQQKSPFVIWKCQAIPHVSFLKHSQLRHNPGLKYFQNMLPSQGKAGSFNRLVYQAKGTTKDVKSNGAAGGRQRVLLVGHCSFNPGPLLKTSVADFQSEPEQKPGVDGSHRLTFPTRLLALPKAVLQWF